MIGRASGPKASNGGKGGEAALMQGLHTLAPRRPWPKAERPTDKFSWPQGGLISGKSRAVPQSVYGSVLGAAPRPIFRSGKRCCSCRAGELTIPSGLPAGSFPYSVRAYLEKRSGTSGFS